MLVREPYDWEAILAWLGARAIPGIERVEGGAYRRGNVRVTYDGAVHTNREAARVRRLFDVAFDPALMHALFARDAMLAPLLRKRPGVRVPGAWDPFELMVRAVVGQQISVAGARTILGRIAATHGLDPHVLAEVTLDGMPRKRAETIRLLAREVVQGKDVDLESIPGIGPWTASYIRMRLGDPDAFPAGDLILRRNAGNLTERELTRRAEAWRPFRAYAAMLLWMG
ncbi:MAG TPA: AlkA N-terminal domain-containing protein [Thermoanaerobaculia bacterium]|jgi:AraC family transcriptional regulator of adaptative response / DNA-3-methyladenine glycosylase II